MNGWLGMWMDGWMDGWTDGGGCTHNHGTHILISRLHTSVTVTSNPATMALVCAVDNETHRHTEFLLLGPGSSR